jgi:FkbM family methyltransferase
MFQHQGWWFPEEETHFPRMLDKSIAKNGPAEYQYQVRNRSLGYVKQKRVALDIGANVGLWSRDLAKHFISVHAFEPVAMFRECLERNVFSPKLKMHSVALGNEPGFVNMIITEGNTGHTHVDPTSMGLGNTEIVTLDSLDFNIVDYIKVDCEGFEYRVLQGAEQTIRRCCPIVVIEQKPHDAYSKEYGQFAAVELLQSWGMIKLDQVKDDWIMGWK